MAQKAAVRWGWPGGRPGRVRRRPRKLILQGVDGMHAVAVDGNLRRDARQALRHPIQVALQGGQLLGAGGREEPVVHEEAKLMVDVVARRLQLRRHRQMIQRACARPAAWSAITVPRATTTVRSTRPASTLVRSAANPSAVNVAPPASAMSEATAQAVASSITAGAPPA